MFSVLIGNDRDVIFRFLDPEFPPLQSRAVMKCSWEAKGRAWDRGAMAAN